jgi:hypothetical protein
LSGGKSPSTPIISPKITNPHVDLAFLFNIAERWGNYVFEDENPPPIALRTRIVSYTLGAYKIFIESFVVQASKTTHWIGN